ncbi:PucR family transcriptional regulator [Actinomycetospora termitidis]|uniref:Helix-turn-helix domain-containing protein n=1 Tax=Actinomycetospora termitidis TaxID=3053470 RepID=A0ABT7M1A5_9PSEU|nr:helix-turn-helix domain-containing protein [Actinomycetospora sp. Odt1-22]MDL5154443.1 helix-turn-helix domain-containing protein [Actinomycetospora sp. Odt1-22]
MTHRAGTVDEVQHLVDELADELGRSVVVNDPGMHLLNATRHFADEDPVRVRAVLQRDPGTDVADYVLGLGVAEWTGPGVIPAEPALELRSRCCVPVRQGSRLLGLLLVIDADGSLTPAELERLREAADVIARCLADRELEATRTSATAEGHATALLDGGPDERAEARRALVAGGLPDLAVAAVTTIVARAPVRAGEVTRVLRTAATAHLRRGSRRGVAVAAGGRVRLVVVSARPGDRDAEVTAARRLAVGVGYALGTRADVVVGLGGEVPGLDAAGRSGAQAELAARGARLLPRHGGVARYEDVADHAVLLRLPDEALTPDLVPDALRRLVDHESGGRLRPTLEIYLDLAGSVPRTAERLHLHRTSLYYRLRQIGEITGVDLDDGRQRLVLHQGLRALELLEGRS